MTKQEIVDIVSDATGLTKVGKPKTVMNGIMGTIIDSLSNNERLSFVDLVHSE